MTTYTRLSGDHTAFFRTGGDPEGLSTPIQAKGSGATQDTTLRTVLVVDDERLIADTIVKILKMHGYDAYSAYSAAEALQMSHSLRPEYLLSDVMMPELNGVQLAAAVEKLLPSIKIMLFSGHAGSQHLPDRQLVVDSGFTIVSKPLHPEKLLSTLQGLVGRADA